MKKIHVLQHVPYETPGCIENWINERSYIQTVTEFYNYGILPLISSFNWLIVMGGPMSVNDAQTYPWLSLEKRFIKESILAGKTVIGICLGSQLIAEALGSRVYKNSIKEIGWFPVKRAGSETGTDLLSGFDSTETVFHWHGETFDLPQGASLMFSSEVCANQCFIYNKKIIGLQFHIEVTESLLNGMIQNGAEEIIPGQYIQSEDSLRAGLSNIKRNNELMYSLLDGLDKQF